MNRTIYLRLVVIIIFINSIHLFSQGNYRLENFGNRSVLLSGIVTGSVEDLGLTYYNPSRLALIDNPGFIINAQSYQLNRVKLKNSLGNDKTLSDKKFEAKPSMVAGTFKLKFLKDHYFAYSFISKRKTSLDLNYSTEIQEKDFFEEFDGLEKFIGEVNLNDKLTDEWFGLTWAKLLSDNFSVGVSGFFSVYNNKGNNYIDYATLFENQNVSLYRNDIGFSQKSYGLFWKLGLAWKVKNWELGMNINLPYWELVSSGKFFYDEYVSGFDPADDIFTHNKLDNIKANRKEPLSIAIGAGIPIRKSKIHLNVEWYNKISSYDRLVIPDLESDSDIPPSFQFKEELHSVINFGMGAEIYINPRINTYLSFSTDFSPVDKNGSILDLINEEKKDINLNIDYFHLGFGLSMSLKKIKLALGSTYSSGSSTFIRPISFPSAELSETKNESADIKFDRWQFIVGLEIPIFNYVLRVK